jgi:UDP-N-acetylmuramate--alanine ligase
MNNGVYASRWTDIRVHFIAIGGIGMSAVARIAADRGATVTGCDCADSPLLGTLRESGIACHVGHDPRHLRDVDIVVYSSAVPEDLPEMREAERLCIPAIRRGQMLALLTEGRDTIAVSGTHGKTSTTWLIGNILMRAGVDPTIAVGGTVPDLKGNVRIGGGACFVTEADESDGSFLLLSPRYPVVTNIDLDHVERWASIGPLQEAFVAFASAPDDGAAIVCVDCPRVCDILSRLGPCITYGIEHGDVAAHNVRLLPGRAVYDVTWPGGSERDVVLSLPGRHNVQNSLAALAVAFELGLSMDPVLEALADTSHVDRRMQRRGSEYGVAVFDDYAHHPAEIAATLAAARDLARGRLIGLFQPHRYSRTLHLHREFGPAFDELDHLLIAPIYAASEPPIEGVSSELIAEAVASRKTVTWELTPGLDAAARRLVDLLEPGDLLITLGAGDVWTAGDAVLRELRQRRPSTADAAGH